MKEEQSEAILIVCNNISGIHLAVTKVDISND